MEEQCKITGEELLTLLDHFDEYYITYFRADGKKNRINRHNRPSFVQLTDLGTVAYYTDADFKDWVHNVHHKEEGLQQLVIEKRTICAQKDKLIMDMQRHFQKNRYKRIFRKWRVDVLKIKVVRLI